MNKDWMREASGAVLAAQVIRKHEGQRERQRRTLERMQRAEAEFRRLWVEGLAILRDHASDSSDMRMLEEHLADEISEHLKQEFRECHDPRIMQQRMRRMDAEEEKRQCGSFKVSGLVTEQLQQMAMELSGFPNGEKSRLYASVKAELDHRDLIESQPTKR